jgi:hypothetical protein
LSHCGFLQRSAAASQPLCFHGWLGWSSQTLP